MSRFVDRVAKPNLSRSALPLIAALLAMALTATSLKNGLHMDDYVHRLILLDRGERETAGASLSGGDPPTGSDLPWAVEGAGSLSAAVTELFSFARPETTGALVDRGALPWWTLPSLRASFFRPVAAVTHWLDYRLWPNSDVMKHVQSILWYGAVVLLAALLFRRFLEPAWIAGLAAILFAVDEGHRLPAAWLANRNALLALFFGLLALLAYDRWRREGRRSGAFLAPFCLALSLLSAEAGVATCAYLFCHALFLDEKGTLPRRLACLAPCVAVVILWRVVYQHFGFGAIGCGLYVDPGREPLAFLQAVIEQAPVLLFGQLGWPEPSFYAVLSEPAARLFLLFAALFLLFAALVLAPLLFRDRRARFFGGAMVLAVLPSCGTRLPSERLLLFAGFGAMGLVALFAGSLLEVAKSKAAGRLLRVPARTLLLLLLCIHLAAAPLQLAVRSRQPPRSRTVRFTDIGPAPGVDRQSVVVVNAPNPFDFAYLQAIRAGKGLAAPARIRVLAPGRFPVALTRIDEKTLRVEPEQGWLAPPAVPGETGPALPWRHSAYSFQLLDSFFRAPSFPMQAGWKVALAGMTAEVVSLTADGRPGAALFCFDLPLEDRSLLWIEWDWEKKEYRPLTLPAIGETRRTRALF